MCSPPLAGASVPPALLQDLQQLREYYEEANCLERQISQLSSKAKENSRHLAVARRQAAEAKSRKAKAAERIPKLNRAKKEIRNESVSMAAALSAERENCLRRAKDNRGLSRSLARLRQKLGDAALHTDGIEEAMKLEAECEEVARIEEDTLKQTIEGMDGIQERLKKQVAAEHEKRSQLKAAARAKLERVEKSHAGLKEKLDEHEAAVAEMKERLAKQEEHTSAAQNELMLSREAFRQAALRVEQQQEARLAMHAELLAVQRAHEKLRTDLYGK